MTTVYTPATHIGKTLRVLATYCLLAVSLTACLSPETQQSTESTPEPATRETEALQLLSQGQVFDAVQVYTVLAADSTDPAQRQDFELKAIEALLDAGHIDMASEKLRTITQPDATPDLAKRHQIDAARIAIALGEAEKALALLPADLAGVPKHLQVHAQRVAAQAHQTLGDIENALLARMQLTQVLSDDEEVAQNHQQIWHILDKQTDIQLASLINTGNGSTYQGWLALTQTVRNTRRQRGQLKNTVPAWARQFPLHPATEQFTSWLVEQTNEAIDTTGQIALLLPFSGKLGTIVTAVRDGFFAAYYADDSAIRPGIRLYDVSDTRLDILQHHALAVSEGAQVIIGPLDKASIGLLAAQQTLEVPTLGLNYRQNSDTSVPDNLFQFGLLPEDEARTTAEFAVNQGHTRAVVLTPDSAWGNRLAGALKQRLHELGGTLLDAQTFAADTHDFSQQIQRLLNLDRSQSRKNTLQNILGRKLEFEPQRRQDVDFIFLAAAAQPAREITPQFKFHRGGDIPIYATSKVFSGTHDALKDSDMNGLLVCDIPWLLSDAADNSPLYQQVNAHWSQKNSLARLYALGIDAYQLLPHLNTLRSDPTFAHPGRTGNLTLGVNQRIQRHLQWARFIEGVPVKLPTVPTPAPLLPDSEINPNKADGQT